MRSFISKIKSAQPLVFLLVLTGCESSNGLSSVDAPPSLTWTTAEWIAGDQSLYNVSAEMDAATSRDALFRLASALDAGYQALDFKPPFPSIRIIDPKHALMSSTRIGLAVVTETGEERIYINRSYLERRSDIEALIIHEIAHLKAWHVYGRNISAHGVSYQKVYRSALARRDCERVEY